MSELLFVYGTLHPDRAPAQIASTARRLKPLGKATVRGCLYDLGAYPGVLLADESDNTAAIIHGELFRLPDGPEGSDLLARLDAYEDFRADDPQHSLFLRQRTQATFEDGARLTCWIYTYNRSHPEGPRIR